MSAVHCYAPLLLVGHSMISIQNQHCPDRGRKRIRFKLEYAGLIGVLVWFGIAYWLFHR